jgi:hypothetical protein
MSEPVFEMRKSTLCRCKEVYQMLWDAAKISGSERAYTIMVVFSYFYLSDCTLQEILTLEESLATLKTQNIYRWQEAQKFVDEAKKFFQ